MSATPPTQLPAPQVRPAADDVPSVLGVPPLPSTSSTPSPGPTVPGPTAPGPTAPVAVAVAVASTARPVPPVPRLSGERALLPNLLVPGVSHAGAAMLSTDLGRHPQVCLPSGSLPGPFAPLRYGRPVQVHPHDYDGHYPGWAGQRYRIEASPDYLDGGRAMALALAERLPGLRVAVLLRDPAHRLWTGYTDQLARGRLPGAISFDTFVDRCLALRANGADRFEVNRHFRTLSAGFYVEYLPDWLDVFGDRLRVLFTEDLHDDPAAQVRAVWGWLGLDPVDATPAGGLAPVLAVPGPRDASREPRRDASWEPGRDVSWEPRRDASWEPRRDVVGEADGGYPVPDADPSGRRLWPGRARAAGWRRHDLDVAAPLRVPRQTDRARARVRGLYAAANAELAAALRARGVVDLPVWLRESGL